ncbi:hypothetical protein QBC43DRAFT_310854 [Cladorrhinum sp. PSN259]|nr:hypothetical protein QBC43DRAFT_310854 [Cladorrhinum sp. PSN259]
MNQSYSAQPDYSGLQVIEGNAPEVVIPWIPPEVVHEQDKYHHHQNVYDQQQAALLPYTPGPSLASVPHPITVPWWRRKRWLFLLIAAIALAITAIVVGVVVGTRKSSSTSTTNPTPDTTPPNTTPSNTATTYPPSACRDTICPQILSSAILNHTTLFLFARGIDNSIYYTTAPLNSKTASLDFAPWSSIPSSNPFLTQPSALTWANSSKVSVLAGSDPDRVVKLKTFSLSSPSSISEEPWKDLGLLSQSAISTCTVNSSRPDFWSTSDTTVAHNYLLPDSSNPEDEQERFYAESSSQIWQGTTTFGLNTILDPSSKPGIVCRQAPYFHDLVVLDVDGAARHSTYGSTGWVDATNKGGKFGGDPTLVQLGNWGFEFYGISRDSQEMWHFRWTKSSGYTSLEKLGENKKFESVPGVVVTGESGIASQNLDEVRVDLVALGNNDRLWHRSSKGGKVNNNNNNKLDDDKEGLWENLDVYGNSAPLVVDIEDGKRVGIFVVGVDGQVNHTVWTVSEEEKSWKGLIWKSIGGNMTAAFYRS